MKSNNVLINDEIMPIPRESIYSLHIKRLLDLIMSGIALIILLPVFILVSILELIFHGRPILYASKRPGKNGQVFNIFKFRSMTNVKGESGQLLDEEFRLTRFGRFLRRTSLDELPELWSIFVGDMSFVGPRPLLTEYMELYTPRHKMRQSIRPGLLCPRIKKSKDDVIPDKTTWRDQFENDIYYVENISFLLDVMMFIGIALEAVKGESYRTNDTRVRFDGLNLDDTRSKQEALLGSEVLTYGKTLNLE